VIDLHLHTTASDGASSPEVLAEEARAAGLTTIAVTDHDTMAGVAAVTDAAGSALTVIPGIEITAVERGRDVHVLGYFLDAASGELQSFLTRQRADRRRRLVDILDRLAAIGAQIDAEPLLARAAEEGDRAVGRLLIANALIEAGLAADIADAFDRFLGAGQPAFVPREGSSAAAVVALIRRAGGLPVLAHPGKTERDDLIPALVSAGLAGLEVFHPDHDASATTRYAAVAAEHGLARTGGSDYHGPGTRRAAHFGRIGVPSQEYAALVSRRVARARP
jgi:3',5'-nucleoside bisphosphate phosphatase